MNGFPLLRAARASTAFALFATCLHGAVCLAQTAPALKIIKVDPPNWYATLPKPMLLVNGEGLGGTTFALSDAALTVERTVISENGHWAQVWLGGAPATAETVQLRVTRGADRLEVPYTFAAPRAANGVQAGLAGFSGKDVIYLIVTDRFADGDLSNDGPLGKSSAASPEAAAERAKVRGWHGGDLRGVAEHLDYLQDLGATTVWTTPVYQNHGAEAYHGYHCTDYYAVDEHYGTLADLQALAAKLHARGMKLVLDTVPNHVGPNHPWVRDEPAPDWFHGTLAHHPASEYNFHALVDPHSSEHDRVGTLTGWFADALPDMNTDSPAVAKYLRQNAEWWLEQTGADGLRIDTYAYVNRSFWQAYDGELKQLFPHVTEVGEVFDTDPAVTSFFAGGRANVGGDGTFDTMLYTPFDFPVFGTLRSTLANVTTVASGTSPASSTKPLSALFDTLRADALYPHPERLVTFFGNHDTTRFLSAPGMNVARLKMAYGLLTTLRGTPQMYYGDELGMTGGEDPDNRKDMPGEFAGVAGLAGGNAFHASGRTGDARELHDWVRQAMQFRLHAPALQTGLQQELFGDATAIAFVRTTDEGSRGCGSDSAGNADADRYIVLANEAKSARTLRLPLTGNALAGCTRFAAVLSSSRKLPAAPLAAASGALQVDVGPEEVLVLRALPADARASAASSASPRAAQPQQRVVRHAAPSVDARTTPVAADPT